jgi:hypothetical protein
MAKRKRTDNTMAKRKGTNGQTTQWPKEKEQTTQWPKEKGPMDRQHNGQKKRDQWTNNDLQNITQKTKDPTS